MRLSRASLVGWGALALGLWNRFSDADTALAAPSVLQKIWDGLQTDWGALGLAGAGLLTLWVSIKRPQWLATVFRQGNGNDSNADEIQGLKTRIDELSDDHRNLRDSIGRLEEQVEYLRKVVAPQQPRFDKGSIRQQILINYSGFARDLGAIDRTITFSFTVHNASDVHVQPTFQTRGFLIFEAYVMVGSPWSVDLHPPEEIAPHEEARLDVVVRVSERFAESLAFKADGEFTAGFSDMSVEFSARDIDRRSASLGYIGLGDKQRVMIQDGPAMKQIRAFVDWRENATR